MPTTPPDLTQLRALAGDPASQSAYAATLLEPGQSRAVLAGALAVLARQPVSEAHAPLAELYEHLAANGPKRDAGAFLRRALIDALRPIALPSDAGRLAHAASTVERMPPTFRDEATGLRAAALIVLNEVDETLAAFHATRLLVDEFADPMSGEPSVTAARVLASQDNLLPLYLLVSQAAPPASPDALSECLRSLTSLPVGLLPALVERYSGTTSAAVLAGLYDLLVSHRAGPQALPFLERDLAQVKDADLYRYLLIVLLSARKPPLNELVLAAGQLETDPRKLAILLESLPLFDLGPAGAELTRKLQRRTRPK